MLRIIRQVKPAGCKMCFASAQAWLNFGWWHNNIFDADAEFQRKGLN